MADRWLFSWIFPHIQSSLRPTGVQARFVETSANASQLLGKLPEKGDEEVSLVLVLIFLVLRPCKGKMNRMADLCVETV